MSEKRKYSDRKEYLNKFVTERRRKLKRLAVEYKGGKCNRCGYSTCIWALEFHHIKPKEKSFSLSNKGLTRSWEKVKLELDKCILVCANCHREIEFELDCGVDRNGSGLAC